MEILLEYQNIKIFFAKICTSNSSEEVFVIKKVKILSHGYMLLMILLEKKLLGLFMKKNLELKRLSREKVINYMLNGKDTMIYLIAG